MWNESVVGGKLSWFSDNGLGKSPSHTLRSSPLNSKSRCHCKQMSNSNFFHTGISDFWRIFRKKLMRLSKKLQLTKIWPECARICHSFMIFGPQKNIRGQYEKIHLTYWFKALWWFTTRRSGVNAVNLKSFWASAATTRPGVTHQLSMNSAICRQTNQKPIRSKTVYTVFIWLPPLLNGQFEEPIKVVSNPNTCKIIWTNIFSDLIVGNQNTSAKNLGVLCNRL